MVKGLYRTKAADPTRQALIFQLESGADVFLTEEDMSTLKKSAPVQNNSNSLVLNAPPAPNVRTTSTTEHSPPPERMEMPRSAAPKQPPLMDEPTDGKPRNTQQWVVKSRELALAASTLDDLRAAIAGFEGLEVKTTATNMVFSDGNPTARVMVVGEAPGADEDMQGRPFVGRSGQLLDKILVTAGLSRTGEDNKALYISNVLNWRPPGNRTPTPQEMEIARPFIEKHIALVQPDILLFAGAVAVQTLLPDAPTLGKARGKWHDFKPLTRGIELKKPVKAYALYHPAYLMRSPLQKKKAWHDMLEVMKKLESL